MTKKSRYFLIGGQGEVEEIEEPEMDIQDNDQLIDMTDDVPEDDIDRVLSYIRSENIDPNMDAGIRQFGKREYIKKVLDLIENPVQPVFPGMTGGAEYKEKITKENIDELETDIGNVANEFIKEYNKTVKEDDDKIQNDDKQTIVAVIKYVIIKKKVQKVKYLHEIINDELKIDAPMTLYKNVFGSFIKEFGETVETKGAPNRSGKYYTSVISKLKDRRDKIKAVLDQVDLEGLKKDVSFPNILTLCNYSHILQMSDEGDRDRKAFVAARKDKLDIDVWSDELENSLRAENILSAIFANHIYKLKKWKYDNVFQMVSKQSAFEDIDIKIPDIGYIELKGASKGNIKYNKFYWMAKYYKQHGADADKYFYAMGRKLSNDLDNKTFRIDVIPNQLLKIMTQDEIYKKLENMYFKSLKFYKDPKTEKSMSTTSVERAEAVKNQQEFANIMKELLGYTNTKKEDASGNSYMSFTLPSTVRAANSIPDLSQSTNPETFKSNIDKLKNAPINVENIKKRFDSLYTDSVGKPKEELSMVKTSVERTKLEEGKLYTMDDDNYASDDFDATLQTLKDKTTYTKKERDWIERSFYFLQEKADKKAKTIKDAYKRAPLESAFSTTNIGGKKKKVKDYLISIIGYRKTL